MRSSRSSLAWCLLFPLLATGKEKDEAIAARNAFDKVEASVSVPPAADLEGCVQAQRNAVKPADPGDRPVLAARSAYCGFLKAVLVADASALAQSAVALNAARGNGKNDSASVLAIASAIATLKSGARNAPLEQNLSSTLRSLNCFNSGFARTQTCNMLEGAGHLWLGWLAMNRNERAQAAAAFQRVGASPWNAWLTGLERSEGRRWREASMALAYAAAAWPVRGRAMADWLGPQLAPGELAARLSYAQVMAGEGEAALPNLDAALAAHPADAQALFSRGRLRNSIVDLEAAVKAAQPGDAHLYQAVLFERQHDYAAAAREFDAVPAGAPDLEAWKSLTSAASGACPKDLNEMNRLAASASVLFPRDEYALQTTECRLRATASLEALIALDSSVRSLYLTSSGFEDLHTHFAAAYIRQGVQAEERKDTDAAFTAYRRALEWTPRNSKARFNIAALHFGDQKFDLAEAQYRQLLAIDPNDREGQFWLGQSILSAPKPDEARKAEACGLLQQSIRIQDSAKRDQFATAISTSPCAN